MQKPSYWSILTADVRYDKRLKPNEKLLFSEITALSNKYGFSNASNKYFAELYNVSTRSISAWINNLKKCRYLKVVITKNGSHKKSRKMYPLANPRRKFHATHEKNFKGSHEKNFQWNNTRNNSTRVNSKKKVVNDLQKLMVQVNDFVMQEVDDWFKTYSVKLIFKAIQNVGTRNPNPKYVMKDVDNQLRNGCKVNHYQRHSSNNQSSNSKGDSNNGSKYNWQDFHF